MLENRRHPAPPSGPCPGTDRYDTSFLSFSQRWSADGPWLAAILERLQSAAAMQASVREGESLGDRGLHVEWITRARRGRGFAGQRSPRNSDKAWWPVPRCSVTPAGKPPGSLDRRIGQPRPARRRDFVCPGRRRARAGASRNTRDSSRGVRGRRSPLGTRPGCHAPLWFMPTTTSVTATGCRSR